MQQVQCPPALSLSVLHKINLSNKQELMVSKQQLLPILQCIKFSSYLNAVILNIFQWNRMLHIQHSLASFPMHKDVSLHAWHTNIFLLRRQHLVRHCSSPSPLSAAHPKLVSMCVNGTQGLFCQGISGLQCRKGQKGQARTVCALRPHVRAPFSREPEALFTTLDCAM